MGKKLGIKGHVSRGKEVIELLEMMGGNDSNAFRCNNPNIIYYVLDKHTCWDYIGPEEIDEYKIFTLEEFLEVYPFKVRDKVFLYDNITEGCVTGMEWDEDKGTVKYCVYTSAEYWCDVKELLKWNAEFLVNKEKSEEVDKMLHDITLSHLHRNHLEDVLSELYEHIKTTPKEELEREFEEIKEWSNVGPTVEEFMTFCECVNKKPKYPNNYEECVRIAKNIHGYDIHIDAPAYGEIMESFVKLLICRDAYWKIYGEQMGLDEPWKHNYLKGANTIRYAIYNTGDEIVKLDGKLYRNYILCFPTEEMRDVFHENFKDLIEQCKELL